MQASRFNEKWYYTKKERMSIFLYAQVRLFVSRGSRISMYSPACNSTELRMLPVFCVALPQ
jgi:hypothetical protein